MATEKKVLITAGPTWVALDRARVISNIASGETGFILAEKLKKLGVKVTLLLGPGYYTKDIQGIKINRFKYFKQLKELLEEELKNGKYAAIIHAAAVSDYAPKAPLKGKISSGLRNLKINLVPTEKLIDNFKKFKPLFTVGFKFEPEANKAKLVKKGSALLSKAGLDLVVANSESGGGYCAYILDGKLKHGPYFTKMGMAGQLVKLIKSGII